MGKAQNSAIETKVRKPPTAFHRFFFFLSSLHRDQFVLPLHRFAHSSFLSPHSPLLVLVFFPLATPIKGLVTTPRVGKGELADIFFLSGMNHVVVMQATNEETSLYPCSTG